QLFGTSQGDDLIIVGCQVGVQPKAHPPNIEVRCTEVELPPLVLHFANILERFVKTGMLRHWPIQQKVSDVRHVVIHTQSSLIEKTKVRPKVVGRIGFPSKGIGWCTGWSCTWVERTIVRIVPSCTY